MGHKKRWVWIGLLAALLLVLAACGASAGEDNGDEAGTIPDTVSCALFYRPAAGVSFEESTLSLATNGDQGASDFDDIRFEATLISDVGEGKSLSIAVTDLAAGAELTRQLYQFDLLQGLRDQFIGGHGFTGLAYVFHPTSGSELQYFCGAGD